MRITLHISLLTGLLLAALAASAQTQPPGLLTAPVQVAQGFGPLAAPLTASVALASSVSQPAAPAAAACVATANGRVNMRRGPDVTFELRGVLDRGQSLRVDAQAIGSDGFVWWRLENNTFVRSDTVTLSGGCEAIPSAANR
ncbi:MAG: hypothetical protein ACOCXZ_00180 [Chloroflexota bacterium]